MTDNVTHTGYGSINILRYSGWKPHLNIFSVCLGATTDKAMVWQAFRAIQILLCVY